MKRKRLTSDDRDVTRRVLVRFVLAAGNGNRVDTKNFKSVANVPGEFPWFVGDDFCFRKKVGQGLTPISDGRTTAEEKFARRVGRRDHEHRESRRIRGVVIQTSSRKNYRRLLFDEPIPFGPSYRRRDFNNLKLSLM